MMDKGNVYNSKIKKALHHFKVNEGISADMRSPLFCNSVYYSAFTFTFHSLTLTPSFPKNPGVLFTGDESPTTAPVAEEPYPL